MGAIIEITKSTKQQNKNMDKKTLIINAGSVSKRHGFYIGDEKVAYTHFERCCDNNFSLSITHKGSKEKIAIVEKDFLNSTEYFFNFLKEKNILQNKKDINTIGLRIVAPGRHFLEDKIIDDKYLKELINVKESAPLHIEPVIKEIEYLMKEFGKSKLIGVSDSKFHVDMLERFRYYSIKKSDTEKYDIRRYGYHGISASSIIRKIEQKEKKVPQNIIICHLGSGSSVTAVKNGKSFNTSMGFTPLEGLTMRTRVGNIDPGALIYFAKKENLNFEELENYLNTKCGLLGLSGQGDTRKIVSLAESGDKNAILTLDIYSGDVKEFIGAYSALLNGLDMLIFSGAIGEGSDIIRSKICSEMEYLGIKIDKQKNKNTLDVDGFIEDGTLPVKVGVITTDEVEEIFQKSILSL
ncbi:MAG: acetate kinase [Parcubacteria group bacterium Athens0714_16]|nr:MAG: acetate kinase [Parcubacteria group bacterium Athens0714_16]